MAARPQLTGRAAILAIVVCAIAMSLAYPVREYVVQRRQIAHLEQEKAREIAAIKALDDRLRQSRDPGFIKRVGRERLFYCAPGEKCYVVMGKTPSRDGGAGQRKATVRPPWYATLWDSVKAADSGGGEKAAKETG
ncbi:septum formation initiator family protein [Streptosporangium sp. NPDC023615]|uniref:FtsB family cell division protein n=1 Tax=Streptosporangium sp. NPDC023615 TaxID=3154794 RepID=UPI00342703CB